MREIKKSFWDFVTVSGSTIISIPLMVISESIQARYLGPAGYGKVALIISAISLLYLFGLSWLERAVLRYGKEEFLELNHFRRTTGNLLIIILVSLFFTVGIFYLFQDPIFAFLEIRYPYAFMAICAGLVLTAGRSFLLEALKVVRLIKVQTFLLRVANKMFILSGMLILAFILFQVDVINVIAVFLATDLFIILVALAFLKWRYFFPLQFDRSMFRTILVYSIPLLFTSWSVYVVNWIDTYVIKYYMTMEDVGVYQAAYKILNTLYSFWGVGLITITTPIILVFKSKKEFNKINNLYLKRLVPHISYFTLIVVALIILFSDIGFRLIYGLKFADSVTPFKILFTTQCFTVITFALTPILTSFDMTRMMLVVGVSSGLLNILADILLVPIFGINGAALASFLIFSTYPLLWYYYIGIRFTRPGKLSIFFALISILILLINLLLESMSWRIVFTCSVLVATTLIARRMYLFIPDDIQIFKNIDMPNRFRLMINGLIRWFSR